MAKSLTFTLVSTERQWQGGEEQALQLARGLVARGHRCLFAALDGGQLASRMRHAGFPVGILLSAAVRLVNRAARVGSRAW